MVVLWHDYPWLFDPVEVEVKTGNGGRKRGSFEALHGIESLVSTAAGAASAAAAAACAAVTAAAAAADAGWIERIERKARIELHLFHVLVDDLDAFTSTAVGRPLDGAHAPAQVADHRRGTCQSMDENPSKIHQEPIKDPSGIYQEGARIARKPSIVHQGPAGGTLHLKNLGLRRNWSLNCGSTTPASSRRNGFEDPGKNLEAIGLGPNCKLAPRIRWPLRMIQRPRPMMPNRIALERIRMEAKRQLKRRPTWSLFFSFFVCFFVCLFLSHRWRLTIDSSSRTRRGMSAAANIFCRRVLTSCQELKSRLM